MRRRIRYQNGPKAPKNLSLGQEIPALDLIGDILGIKSAKMMSRSLNIKERVEKSLK